jgi:RNA-splicing ligase RtcB
MSGEAGGNHGFDVLSPEGKDYLKDMMFALRFALKNREIMMEKTLSILGAKTLKFINKNHNCADVRDDGTILHRKGATSSFE